MATGDEVATVVNEHKERMIAHTGTNDVVYKKMLDEAMESLKQA